MGGNLILNPSPPPHKNKRKVDKNVFNTRFVKKYLIWLDTFNLCWSSLFLTELNICISNVIDIGRTQEFRIRILLSLKTRRTNKSKYNNIFGRLGRFSSHWDIPVIFEFVLEPKIIVWVLIVVWMLVSFDLCPMNGSYLIRIKTQQFLFKTKISEIFMWNTKQ